MEKFPMKQRLDVITLGVEDLERSLAFYRDGLGFATTGIVGQQFHGSDTEPAGAVVFFELQDGLRLALYPRKELAKDAGEPGGAQNSREFSMGYVVDSRAAVDDLLKKAVAAGATMTGSTHDRPWGIYSGYFKDPDGHLWEIIWIKDSD
jgi:uncharacterized protein